MTENKKIKNQKGTVIRTIKSDSGRFDLVLKVTGYSNELSSMRIENPFEVQGREIRGEVFCRPASDKLPEHIYIRSADVAIAYKGAVALRTEMEAELPKKIHYIYKHDVTINLDGHKVTTANWEHEGYISGMSKSEIEEYLENEEIDCISADEMQAIVDDMKVQKTNELIKKAKEAGHKIEISRDLVECNDPNEDCSTDILIRYIDETGNITTERRHTY